MTEAAARPDQRTIRMVFGALLLVMLLASLDQTIVSTALPTIVGEFGGLEHLSWIVTAYMLATTVVTPLFGKLGDLFGRKLVLQGAILLFLAGSMLCGASGSMTELILFRAMQGLGGGGLMVTAMAVVGDLVSPRERGRYQGLFGATFGVSTVLGPLVGGYFVEHLTWRWIFYINLPLGLLALAVIGFVFASPAQRKTPSIDYAGAVLLAIALTATVLLASLGGHTLPWGSPASIGLGTAAVAATGLFILAERRAQEPILPPSLFCNRTFVIAALVGFIVGVAMFGAITYMPVYLQVVKGSSPSEAGLALTPMMGGVLLTSITSGQVISRTGRYRIFPIIGTAVMTAGLLLLSTLGVDTPVRVASLFMLVLGLGLGMVMQVLILSVQNAVDYRNLGTATSGATLFRSIGGAIGVAAFGAIFAGGLAMHLGERLAPGASLPSATDAQSIAALPAPMQAIYRQAFVEAPHPVFLTAAAIALIAFALSWLMQEIALRETARADDLGESFAMPRDATSLEELAAILDRITRKEAPWNAMARIAERLDLDLKPDEIWLLVHLARTGEPAAIRDIARAGGATVGEIERLEARLLARDLVDLRTGAELSLTPDGRAAFENIATRYRARLAEICQRWSPEDHPELREMITNFARHLLGRLPREAGS